MISILADESLNGKLVNKLRETGVDIEWILEIKPGISDHEVIEIAISKHKILVTEDKDFGEWVFSHQVRDLSIVFIRYAKPDVDLIFEALKKVLKNLELIRENHEFITIAKNKIRRRKI